METLLYCKIANEIEVAIRQGVYLNGQKLPSVRQMSERHQVSISTVMSAYQRLEQLGVIEVRPKSGFYVRSLCRERPLAPALAATVSRPEAVTTPQKIMQILRDSDDGANISFGAAVPSGEFPLTEQMRKLFAQLIRKEKFLGVGYPSDAGQQELRQQLARRAVDSGVLSDPDEIIITAGCQGALALCLQALTQAGDIVAVETPCYYGILQMIESLGLRAIEIPSDAVEGMSIDALQLALEQWPVKVILTIPTFSNPVGSLMPDDHKQALLALAYRYDIPVIEDDVYGELCYANHRPKALKAFDTRGQVLLCSSVSKTLDPQLGVGWVMAGHYRDRIEYQKFLSSTSSFGLSQRVVAEVLAQGMYDRHLRLVRETYRQRRDQLLDLIAEHFPQGTRVSAPQGGFVAWIQLPQGMDAVTLYKAAKQKRIIIAPGEIFSSNPQKYPSAFRVSYASAWTRERIEAFKLLAKLVA